ncbi:Yos1-like protein [Suillus placidus]|uniref:Yos1-like protein n=1 Tax=Suillus placidus TaxID=48579 RepID=A0A9P7A0U7_9AGAM|nr:Yos1-like protein [Suillus placidus]KAG2348899.1 Yos1-like protein [Suillus weaverae]
MLTLGTILYVSLLLINAMAVLSEDRFLAKIGWSSVQNAGFQPPYDQSGYGYTQQQDAGVKVRLINLISAVRTLMRIPLIGLNLVIIVYELILGG